MDNATLERVERKVDDIHRRLFVGNGEAPVMTRLDRLEQRVDRSGGWWDLAKSVLVAVVTVGLTMLGMGVL